MKRLFAVLPVLLIFVIVIYSASGYAEGNPSAADAPYFSNKDLDQYRKPSDGKIPDARTGNKVETREERAKGKAVQKEQEYWCKKATSYKRKIDMGKDKISEMEKELSSDTLNRKKKGALEKKLNAMKKQVTYTEQDMSDLEDEAHRKDIPPGWLRCQFE